MRAAAGVVAGEAGAGTRTPAQQKMQRPEVVPLYMLRCSPGEVERRAKTKAAADAAWEATGGPPANDASRAAAMVTVGPASGDTDDPFRAGREAAAARAQAAAARTVVRDGMRRQPKATPGTGQPSGGQAKAQTQGR